MTVDRWQQVERLFEAAVEHDGAARAAYLDAACSGDAELRRHVSTLLDADASPSWLDAGPERLATSLLDDTPAAELIGSCLGPYRLIAMLGAGGSGVVFLAERNDIGSTVALKLLRDAWVSPTRRGRFLEEQRTLARLSHPCIARIFDAGGEDGRVWFAMECVEGLPLDEYLRRRRLPLAETLRLLRRICGAVQYAHERLVVHRDLKPSNILVLADGTPKLVDFGIAMNLERPDDHYAGPVRFLTPAYAAPEEVRGESLGVPADVYSLGTILGELLQSDPSDRIGRSRHADLVAIAAKAAHPEPASRYATVEGLDRDLGAFLAGFPVSARPLGALPRAGRFIARHRRRVIALGLAAVSLIGVASYYGVRLATARAETRAEASRSDRLLKFVLSLFEGGTAGGAPPADLRVVSLLERGVREADGLSADPPARAELLETLGQIYLELGDLGRADALLGEALTIRRATPGAHPDVVGALLSVADVRLAQARLDEAEQMLREARALGDRLLSPAHPDRIRSHTIEGRLRRDRGDYAAAAASLEAAASGYAVTPALAAEHAEALAALAESYFYAGRIDDAERANSEALALTRRVHGPRHPGAGHILLNAGAVAASRQRLDAAEAADREALEIFTGWYGERHPETASAMTILAQVLGQRGDYDAAVALLRQALEVQVETFGAAHPRTAFVQNELGLMAFRKSDLETAAAAFAQAVRGYDGVAGRHFQQAVSIANLGSVHLAAGDHPRAQAAFLRALDIYRGVLPADHLNIAVTRAKLGRTLLRQAQFTAAAAELQAAIPVLERQPGPESSWLKAARADLADVTAAAR